MKYLRTLFVCVLCCYCTYSYCQSPQPVVIENSGVRNSEFVLVSGRSKMIFHFMNGQPVMDITNGKRMKRIDMWKLARAAQRYTNAVTDVR